MGMIYYVIAFAAGLGITLQTTLNSQLAKGLGGDPVTAALFSFTAGAFSLGIYALLRGGVDDIASGDPVATPLESGGRNDRRMCTVQLCRACAENRVFSSARAGDCRTVTFLADD